MAEDPSNPKLNADDSPEAEDSRGGSVEDQAVDTGLCSDKDELEEDEDRSNRGNDAVSSDVSSASDTLTDLVHVASLSAKAVC